MTKYYAKICINSTVLHLSGESYREDVYGIETDLRYLFPAAQSIDVEFA